MSNPFTSTKSTTFNCKLCNHPLEFNIQNPRTFSTKTEKRVFFGMQLVTYRLYHDSASERHHNAVLVDLEGSFRGHVDAYIEVIEPIDVEKPKEQKFWLTSEEAPEHFSKWLDLFLIFDQKEGWVSNIVCPIHVRPLEIVKAIEDKLEETNAVYDTLPSLLRFIIADIKIYTYTHESKRLLITPKSLDYLLRIQPLLRRIIEYDFSLEKGVPNVKAFKTCVKLFDVDELQLGQKIRLLIDETLHTPIYVPMEEDLFRVVFEELTQEFGFTERIIMNLLEGRTSVIDLLGFPEFTKKSHDLVSIIDFGRKLSRAKKTGERSIDPQIQERVSGFFLKYRIISELEKGTKPKKIANEIFDKELKNNHPDIIHKFIVEIILQTLQLAREGRITYSLEELIRCLQDLTQKQAKDVSRAMF